MQAATVKKFMNEEPKSIWKKSWTAGAGFLLAG